MIPLELTDGEIEIIRNGGPAPFGIKDLAKASGMSVRAYAAAHGISVRTAEGWAAGKPVKPFIVAALYFWDKSAGIF